MESHNGIHPTYRLHGRMALFRRFSRSHGHHYGDRRGAGRHVRLHDRIPDAAVALTVVALGTSLPDTFASRLAIMYATDADAAVGNVTGSNSVNVFLGLGLPWVMASLYGGPIDPATGKNGPYIVPTGSLSL